MLYIRYLIILDGRISKKSVSEIPFLSYRGRKNA